MSALTSIKKNAIVEIVDDERDIGNGIIITLKRGWTFDPMADNRVRGEDTTKEALQALKEARPFSGPYED